MSSYKDDLCKPYLVFYAVLVSLFLSACGGLSFKPDADENAFSEQSLANLTLNSVTYELSDSLAQMQYQSIGAVNKTPVLMVHGTPGSWESFRYILGDTDLQNDFHLAATNRLGWNDNSDINFKSSANFKYQAAALANVIKGFSPDKPVLLVGHSLGASIIPRVALDHPELVAGVLLISGTIDPELGKPRWYNTAAKYKVINLLLSERMRLANIEITQLQENLQGQAQIWESITVPVTVIQGSKDKLVSPKNSLFAQKKLARLGDNFEMIKIKNAGHFTIWENIGVIKKALQQLKARTKKG